MPVAPSRSEFTALRRPLLSSLLCLSWLGSSVCLAQETRATPAEAVHRVESASAAATTSTASTRARVVFQVSDGELATWQRALGNLFNTLKAYGPDGVEIELVAYGAGLPMLKKDSPVAAAVSEALSRHVRLLACENTLRGLHLSVDDLVPGVATVPSGVVEIIQRQREGYAYIRP